MEKNNDLTFAATNSFQTQSSSLAHEQLAKDEQFVGALFATMLILANREIHNITPDKFAFTEYYKDTELYVSQKNFVKKIVTAPLYKDVMDYFVFLLDKSETSQPKESPLDIFFNGFKKGDKAFLIRQIFKHTDQVLEKYRFLQDFTQNNENIDIDLLNRGLWTLPIEQKILCISYIFSQIKDNFTEEKETIGESIKKQETVDPVVKIDNPEEEWVHKFFCSFYIQFLLQKDFANTPILKMDFIKNHMNDEIYASQRIFIKNLISNPSYKIFCDEMKSLFIEYNETKSSSPCQIFLNRMNKEIILRQVFVLATGKYKFLHIFVDLAENSINLNELYNHIWHLSQEQQIIIYSYIFSRLHDTNIKKKKLVKDSFAENCKRVQTYSQQTGKGTQTEADNIDFFLKMLNLLSKR